MWVSSLDSQHLVIREAVCNHAPQVLVVDEVLTSQVGAFRLPSSAVCCSHWHIGSNALHVLPT
jgi:hypothetical protein